MENINPENIDPFFRKEPYERKDCYSDEITDNVEAKDEKEPEVDDFFAPVESNEKISCPNEITDMVEKAEWYKQTFEQMRTEELENKIWICESDLLELLEDASQPLSFEVTDDEEQYHRMSSIRNEVNMLSVLNLKDKIHMYKSELNDLKEQDKVDKRELN